MYCDNIGFSVTVFSVCNSVLKTFSSDYPAEFYVAMFVFLFIFFPADIKERFTSYVLLLIVCLRNMEQFSWNPGV